MIPGCSRELFPGIAGLILVILRSDRVLRKEEVGSLNFEDQRCTREQSGTPGNEGIGE